MLYLILFVILLGVALLIKKFRVNSNYWKKKNILQVEDMLWTFTFDKRSMAEVAKTVYDKYDAPFIGTTLATTPTLMLKTAEDIQAVFAGDFQSFHKRGVKTNEDDILAHNLLFLEDYNKWKLIRQKLSPVFTSMKLKNMFYIIEKCARDFVKLVENDKEMRQTPFKVLYTYTTASIGASVFGIDTKTSTTMNSPFLEMAWKSVDPTLKTNAIIMLSGIWPKLFELLKLKIFGDHEDFFVGVVKRVLENRRQNPDRKRHDFIEIALELQKQGVMHDAMSGYDLELTDELVAAQAFFFFIAGADTTANAMHFTLLELSSNQHILKKVHEEIDSVIDSDKEELTYVDIDKLQYLDMVINEAVRKYPPIGVVQRMCTKDTVLPSNVKIAKDVAIVVPILAIHRDERFYPNPDKFDPERFRPENAGNINKFTYLPFGEGNRICIGARFARLQMKAGLTWLLRRYTLGEQNYAPKKFESSPFGLRDSLARYDFIRREV